MMVYIMQDVVDNSTHGTYEFMLFILTVSIVSSVSKVSVPLKVKNKTVYLLILNKTHMNNSSSS